MIGLGAGVLVTTALALVPASGAPRPDELRFARRGQAAAGGRSGIGSFTPAAADPRLAAALVTVFIRVSDRTELRRRLTGRGTDPADEIDRRVAAAEEELRHAGSYQHVIESGTREADFNALLAIYHAEKARRS